MDDFDLLVSCTQRNGLVFELATLMMSVGFKMVSQTQLENTATTVLFSLKVRGDRNRLAELEQKTRAASFVQRLELAQAPSANAAQRSPPSAPKPAPANGPIDQASLDAILPKLAAAYPNFVPLLEQFSASLPAELRPGTLRAVGVRVGAWVYKRDFSRGAKMAMPDFFRRVVLVAAKPFAELDTDGNTLSLSRSSFSRLPDGINCQFFAGYFSGFSTESANFGNIQFVETHCRVYGAAQCVFAHQHQ